jgi:glycosyltransferase involved in cell wall biosynthesis
MANILFYSPFNQRSRDTESLMIAFNQQGHQVFSLSQQEGREIHPFLKSHGIKTYSFLAPSNISWLRHLRHIFFFITFCRTHKIDIVYSHLESANFIASIGQYFVRATVFICRHHNDQYAKTGNDRAISYKLTYWLAKKVIVVSSSTRNFMINHEGVSPSKIITIRLAYNFSLYPQPDWKIVDKLKTNFKDEIVLITIGHLTSLKRPLSSIQVLYNLLNKGFKARLLLLGKGEMETALKEEAMQLGVNNSIIFTGYVNNVLDYIAASTVLLHPSLSEASCVVVKEAGLLKVPVVVCRGVGDFDDYIIHGENGYAVDPDNFVEESVAIIVEHLANKQNITAIGQRLHKTVVEWFSIDNVITQYDPLNTPL